MERQQLKTMELQQSLRELKLKPKQDGEGAEPYKVLARKIMGTRVFRRFTITEIVNKIWRTRNQFKVEKVDENTFKFVFSSKGDRDHIYKNRLWFLDGAHLILKPWPENKILKDLCFGSTTLWMQIHGLPPEVIHEGTTERIGSHVGTVHLDTINKRCIVAYSYLRVRVDIPVKDTIPADFFYAREDDEIWIQFKYEWLPDFCFK